MIIRKLFAKLGTRPQTTERFRYLLTEPSVIFVGKLRHVAIEPPADR